MGDAARLAGFAFMAGVCACFGAAGTYALGHNHDEHGLDILLLALISFVALVWNIVRCARDIRGWR